MLRIQKNIYPLALLLTVRMFLFSGVTPALGDEKYVLDTFLLNIQDLQEVKSAAASGDHRYAAALKQLISDAGSSLDAGPFSVMQKAMTPPSGDRHDYMSMGPYWWPNPDTPDGLPYIRRDGQVNPERNAFDKITGAEMCKHTLTLALAYHFTGENRYASHAARLIRTWFLDAETRMNPNLNFGQHIPGRSQGRGVGIIETRNFIKVIDAVQLLDGSVAWTEKNQVALEQWFASFLDWLLTSDIGLDEAARSNNHGTWYDVQITRFAMFAGKHEIARKQVAAFSEKRIMHQIAADGRQPLELERTRAFSYSVMNLEGHFVAAMLADRLGMDLWAYAGPEEQGLRKALDYLIPYATGDKVWPYPQITGWERPRAALIPILLLAAQKYRWPAYAVAARRVPLANRPLRRYNLLFHPEAESAAGYGNVDPEMIETITVIESARVLRLADAFLSDAPKTITAVYCERSSGGRNDYYSEGDYWWPDPDQPDGPYIRRDGMSNPDNFTAHRELLIRLSRLVPTLAVAYQLTGNERYASHAIQHLKAWFVDGETRMNPHLSFAQAIKGRVKGRGVGIIDTIHLVEVARSIDILAASPHFSNAEHAAVKAWFADYLEWTTTDPNGIDERKRRNNHGSCWVLQVAAYAQLVGNDSLVEDCRNRFKTVLIPQQIDREGRFPLELQRTKPYGYSLFNLDILATLCHLLSDEKNQLWAYTTENGAGLAKAMRYMVTFISDKSAWPYPSDVMYFDQWPVRHPSLLFAALLSGEANYFELWKKLDGDPEVPEIMRNFPIRQPLLWLWP